jgi:glycosyltransferase involved in cell wall biosynthesis
VVLGVRNEEQSLDRTLWSVLTGQEVDLEVVVVDDGSTDATPGLLAGWAASDSRIRVLRQEGLGLTRALAAGCRAAGGEFIARQDAGDASRPGRFVHQLDAFVRHPEAALVSTGVLLVGPRGEPMVEHRQSAEAARAGLAATERMGLHGPRHGTVMFRRSLYEEVGGYRPEFYFAQDIDLWLRMTEHGEHVALTDILYEASFSPASITGKYRREQEELTHLALACALRRRAGGDESPVLEKAGLVKPEKRKAAFGAEAASLVFIGSCLLQRRDPRAAGYFRTALRKNPLNPRAWLGVARSLGLPRTTDGPVGEVS